MKLCSLLKNLNYRIKGNCAINISGLYHRDTEVKEGGLFFCLRGTQVDGNNFVYSAIKNGAVAIVSEQEIYGVSGITQVIVKNAREAMSLISARFFGAPAEKLKIIGVCGTNGKTTITNMLASVCEFALKKVAIIGTNGVFIKGVRYETNMTTPDPIDLQRYLAMMVKCKVEYVCMEVSAHAIDLHKIDGICFEVVIFSNFSEDHLDYFKTMDRYFSTKAKLFSKKYAKFAVLNQDDEKFKELIDGINLPYVAYSKINKSDYFAENIKTINFGQEFDVCGNQIVLPLLGIFNISNALSAIAGLRCLGFSFEQISIGLKNMKPVVGRFNTFDVNGIIVIIDYAHTPDGLKNILLAARDIAKKNKLISIFGCGGNRDALKRPIMGQIADNLSDFVFVTTDNPRFEDAEKIAKDIIGGIKSKNYEIELSREIAIKKAIDLANKGDVVVLAGKGAEDYIETNGKKIPYSDYAEIEKIRRNL